MKKLKFDGYRSMDAAMVKRLVKAFAYYRRDYEGGV